jgi:hypothetical protein
MCQFLELSSAINFMTHYSAAQLRIGGRSVYCSYSRHSELVGEAQNKILLVTFFNPLHKQLGDTLLALITVDLVYQIFSPYGQIHKIVMMSKDAGIQALIQFTSVDGAIRAKTVLSGYSFHAGTEFGTFTIDAQFSNLQDLTVRQPTPRTRDFLTAGMSPATVGGYTQHAVSVVPPFLGVQTNPSHLILQTTSASPPQIATPPQQSSKAIPPSSSSSSSSTVVPTGNTCVPRALPEDKSAQQSSPHPEDATLGHKRKADDVGGQADAKKQRKEQPPPH